MYRERAAVGVRGAVLWSSVAEGGAPTRVLPDGCLDLLWSSRAGLRVAGPDRTAHLSTQRGRGPAAVVGRPRAASARVAATPGRGRARPAAGRRGGPDPLPTRVAAPRRRAGAPLTLLRSPRSTAGRACARPAPRRVGPGGARIPGAPRPSARSGAPAVAEAAARRVPTRRLTGRSGCRRAPAGSGEVTGRRGVGGRARQTTPVRSRACRTRRTAGGSRSRRRAPAGR